MRSPELMRVPRLFRSVMKGEAWALEADRPAAEMLTESAAPLELAETVPLSALPLEEVRRASRALACTPDAPSVERLEMSIVPSWDGGSRSSLPRASRLPSRHRLFPGEPWTSGSTEEKDG